MHRDQQFLLGYDGSPSAASAIETAALLLPGWRGHIAHLWTPPYLDRERRQRMWPKSGDLDELAARVEHEGLAEAERVAGQGIALATASGWQAEALLHRSYGDPGFDLARLAREHEPAVVVVGSRGLSGARALLGSTSDSVVHYTPAPALVVPPLQDSERKAVAGGPVIVGSDGSAGAQGALDSAQALFPDRTVETVAVSSGDQPGSVSEDATVIKPEGVIQSARAVADALNDHAKERDAALIMVGSRGRSARKEILLGSVAMAVLHHAHRPVLVVPAARQPA